MSLQAIAAISAEALFAHRRGGHDHLKRHRNGGGRGEPRDITRTDDPAPRLSALIAALSLNRGALLAAALERLLGLIEATQPSPAKG